MKYTKDIFRHAYLYYVLVYHDGIVSSLPYATMFKRAYNSSTPISITIDCMFRIIVEILMFWLKSQ